MGEDLLAEGEGVAVDGSDLAAGVDDGLRRALGEARELKLERGQRQVGVGRAEELDALLLREAVYSVRVDDGANGDGLAGVDAARLDEALQRGDGEGRILALHLVDKAALGEQTGDGRLTSLEAWAGLAVAGTRELTLVTATGGTTLGRTLSTTATSVLGRCQWVCLGEDGVGLAARQ